MSENRETLKRLLFLPIGLLLNLTPLWALTLMVMCVSLGGFFYYSLNTDFFGLLAPPFAELSFSPDYTSVHLAGDERSWKITYEAAPFSSFQGVVRHVSDWRDEPIPFATHDILVTTGEFTSPARVTTRVYNHAVYYGWNADPAPTGTINLLHIVPKNEAIYRQLLEIREWNQVTISGHEIYRIDTLDASGKPVYYWQDEGCNSILVTSVKVNAPGTPIP
jgi:hypothetical protein